MIEQEIDAYIKGLNATEQEGRNDYMVYSNVGRQSSILK